MVDIDELRERAHKNNISWHDVVVLCDLVDDLRQVCGEAYQLAGAANAPVEALDNLSAAANGEPLPHGSFLPVTLDGADAETAQLLVSHELDLHFHSSREKVSVWHGESLTRVTAFYSDHGGALGALSFAVRRCVETKLQGGENAGL